jgi:hypothetical protein
MLAIEIAFNVFPATPFSSLLLQIAHVVLLIALFVAPSPRVLEEDNTKKNI